ncbi:hypothetical protein M140OLGA_0814 [Staphylococcus aureus subsp. aureus 112808A]|nr:hypothetical protein M140OLGA_0814 [Staphylococcus aureus subsp. aureus 112808A]
MCLHIYELDNDWIDYFILQNDNSVGTGWDINQCSMLYEVILAVVELNENALVTSFFQF